MKRKTCLIKGIIVTLCCLVVLFSPHNAFATLIEDLSQGNRYETLAKINMLMQAAQRCGGTSGDLGIEENDRSAYITDSDDSDKKAKILRLLNLKFKYEDLPLYGSYLEEHFSSNDVTGGKSDGKIWCSEFYDSEKNIFLFDELLDLVTHGSAEPKYALKRKLVCEQRFITIRLVKKNETWPEGWAQPADEEYGWLTSNECYSNYDNIITYVSGDDVVDIEIYIHVNPSNLKVDEWLKEYVGVFSEQPADVMIAITGGLWYLTFTDDRICHAETITRDAYSNRPAGASNYYKVFIYEDPGIKYYRLGTEYFEKEVRAQGSVTDNKKTSCGEIGTNIASFSKGIVRNAQVPQCFETHGENIDKFERIKTYLSYIDRVASNLIFVARKAIEMRPDPNEMERGDPQMMRDFVADSGMETSSVLEDYIYETEQLYNALGEYVVARWSVGGSGNQEVPEEQDYLAKINYYENYRNAFKGAVVDVIESRIDTYLEKNIKLDSAINNDSFYGDFIKYKDHVDGFYYYDDNDNFVCVAVEDDDNFMGEINGILDAEIDVTEYVPPSIDGWDDDGSGPEGETDPCYAGSGSLGWILCPVITAASGIGEFMWDQIESVLFVPVGEIFKDDNGVENAWKVIRDIANVIFIILFLAVIFSQLTGVGIDNYGIKKILPKLIVVAILVNLSYVICKVAIDISNIVGSGIDSMLSGFADSVVTVSGASTGWQIGSWLTTIAGVGAGVTIWVLLSEGGLSEVGAVIGLAALGIVISILAAVTFMYIILGVRMAGVILCTVLSPVAIVCYALPNTEKIYKKWFDLFKALLVVYPICGAMIGMGQFAGAILASIPNGTMKLMAMIVQVVPFFFVPTLLKNSLSLMGNVGAKLSSMGKTFGRKGSGFAKNTIKGTDAYKGFSQRSLERKAERTVNRLGGRRTNLNRRQQARMAAANSVLDERAKRQRENEQKSDLSYRGAMDAKIGLESEESRRNLNDYNNTDFVHAKREQGRLSHDENFQDALLYGNVDYVAGKQSQERLSRENNLEGTLLYTRPGFEDSKRKQYTASRMNEVKKMYSDRYSNTDKGTRQSALSNAFKKSGVDAVEEMDALFDSLMSTGDVAELLDAVNGADFSAMDTGVRDRLVQKMATSGNQILKGFAKAQAGGPISMENYIKRGGLKGYLAGEGSNVLNTADKDTLRFLAANDGAQALSDSMLANLSTTAANNNQASEDAVIKMLNADASRLASIGSKISAEGLTKMSEGIANTYGAANLSDAMTSIQKPGNERMLASVHNDTKRALGL